MIITNPNQIKSAISNNDVFKRNIAKKNNLNFIEIFEKNIKKITKEYVYSLIDKHLEE